MKTLCNLGHCLCVLFLLDDFLLLFYSMILIIVCHAIVPETTTVCLLLVEGHNKTSRVTSKKFKSLVLFSGSSFRRISLNGTSLHKNMLNTRFEREKCSVWLSFEIAKCFYLCEIISSNAILQPDDPSRLFPSSIFESDKFLPTHINPR